MSIEWSSTGSHTVTAAEVTAGECILYRILREGSKLRIVNVLNQGTPWLQTTIELLRYGVDYGASGLKTIALIHREIQRGKKDVHWEGNIPLGAHFRVVRCIVANPVAADVITLSVGYE